MVKYGIVMFIWKRKGKERNCETKNFIFTTMHAIAIFWHIMQSKTWKNGGFHRNMGIWKRRWAPYRSNHIRWYRKSELGNRKRQNKSNLLDWNILFTISACLWIWMDVFTRQRKDKNFFACFFWWIKSLQIFWRNSPFWYYNFPKYLDCKINKKIRHVRTLRG